LSDAGRVRRSVRTAGAAGVLTLSLFTAQLAAAAHRAPLFDGPVIKNPAPTPAFALRDQDGRIVRLGQQRGKVVLLTFLYTHCPDVCPLTARNLNRALRLVGARRTGVRVLAISVDPRGDTPSAVRGFVRAHRLLPEFRYLTGARDTIRSVLRAYGVKSLAQAGDRVDHTLYTVLLDKRLRARVLFDATATPASVAHDVRVLLRQR
jgi:protein SCO1/2